MTFVTHELLLYTDPLISLIWGRVYPLIPANLNSDDLFTHEPSEVMIMYMDDAVFASLLVIGGALVFFGGVIYFIMNDKPKQ
ncbi:hypothetical protein BTA35_0200950 [Oceanospirillum linum]|uniref:Uncharacterized protein n=1 Tax=Oceanospirillum linum TaxID=966 RepID=A0A1T1HE54_OCELI|nr:hypothetical protein BTA35_0200950 [Oceanospirillum linum]